ncbi:unnamed protein product [Fraxinus pennsylvanica]|uniref:Tyrosyl-tRNA synthetase n=1 Tax=Fraxinus pennsylvanica TaxID=56036 RepID=A0AAD1ZMA3_9LAMI|nr:unnamed protein product [Fraxinus pennsylvanica]
MCGGGVTFVANYLPLPHSSSFRRHPYLWRLSLCYSSTQFVQESTDGDVADVRNRLNVVNILKERGFLESLTSDSLRTTCSDPSLPTIRVYRGFNPTSKSLHLGNLLGIIVLSWFLRCGHRVVALVGGATGRVGDPSGKSFERPELDLLALDRNVSGF